jgi:hypothetical protein
MGDSIKLYASIKPSPEGENGTEEIQAIYYPDTKRVCIYLMIDDNRGSTYRENIEIRSKDLEGIYLALRERLLLEGE